MDGGQIFYELKTILKLKSLHCLDHLILQRLNEAGLKACSNISKSDCKVKNVRKMTKSLFGNELENEKQPKENFVVEGHTAYLPKFFVMAVSFLEDHAMCEGIFRKAGSITRQKALRRAINAGEHLQESTSPHDVAALLKQYLRELPEPLLTSRLYPVFVEIIRSSHLSRDKKELLVLLTCLLLPEQHLVCLKILMCLLYKVANSANSLMNSESLSLVISPNIIRSSRGEAPFADMKSACNITQILIENSADIFKLSVDIFHPNDIPDQASSLQDAGRGHHVRRESVSGKIKGTWSKIRGKKSASLKNDDEPSACKKPALEESDDTSECEPPTSVGTAKRNSRRLKNSILYRRKKRKTVINHFNTPCTVPSSTTKPVGAELDFPLSVDRFDNVRCNMRNMETGTPSGIGTHIRETKAPLTTASKVLQVEEFPSSISPAMPGTSTTIGDRVRKRRQHERSLTESTSTDDVGQAQQRSKLPVSQSDSRIWQTTTPSTSVSRRPKLRAIFRRKRDTVEKRKGLVFEPGFDIRALTHRSRQQKGYGICETDENLRLLSGSEDEGVGLLKVEAVTKKRGRHSKDISRPSTPSNCGNVTSLDIDLSMEKASPISKSPGLLKKVTSEINEKFQYTPEHFTPIPNDSYLFAVEDISEQCKAHTSPSSNKKSYDNSRNNRSNVLTEVQNTKGCSLPTQRPPTPIHVPVATRPRLRSMTKPLSTPLLSTPSWKPKQSSAWSGKLSRRARKYLVEDDKQSNVSAKRCGIEVTEWIL